MKTIILAGGGGTRLFPLSRSCFPKQFLTIGTEKSLLAQTVQRFATVAKPADTVIVTNERYYHHVKAELAAGGASEAHILLEPAGRNTAPAVALAARYCLDELGADPGEVLFVTPSDHIIKPVAVFIQSVRAGIRLAETGRIVTFGVRPDRPETGYGYIQAGEPYGEGFLVTSFREKPDRETAAGYLAAGNYYWNSGMFAFTIAGLLAELDRYQPEISVLAGGNLQDMLAGFAGLPDISFDYAVAEQSDKVVAVPLTAYWNDIGSWDAIYDVLAKDGNGNAINGDCIALNCANTLMMGKSRLIAGLGLEDLLVVETDDVILVAKKGESQKVKDIVNELKSRNRREADENTTMFRPWGSYTVLGEGPGYKLKKILVNPGQRLSLQLHYHRSEHWIVIAGTARVTIGEQQQVVHENQSVFVPQTTKHCLENPGLIPLAIIEVQNGRYLGEDDIIRFEDMYGRK